MGMFRCRHVHDIGDVGQAVECFRKAVVHDDADVRAREERGVALYMHGRSEEAVGVYREWLAHEPHDPVPRHLFAACGGEAPPAQADGIAGLVLALWVTHAALRPGGWRSRWRCLAVKAIVSSWPPAGAIGTAAPASSACWTWRVSGSHRRGIAAQGTGQSGRRPGGAGAQGRALKRGPWLAPDARMDSRNRREV